MVSPLEPIMIGYLDSPNVNYELVKYAVVMMFTNQVSPHLIDKFINRNLKAIAWMFIDDEKSSNPNLNTRIDLLTDKCDFEKILGYLITDKNLKKQPELEDVIWRFNYDENYEYIKDILIKVSKILIQYGQYKAALKILELLGDYPLSINLLLLSTSIEDFDMLRIKFEAKECLNFTDNLLINHLFNFTKNDQNNVGEIFGIKPNTANLPDMNEDKMDHYHKIFDNYEGEHFMFGVNQNEFRINSIENIQLLVENRTQKPKGIDFGIQKRVLNPGEKPFQIFSEDYNITGKRFQPVEICSLILQKIENYYGIMNQLSKEEENKLNRNLTFYNYNVTLTEMKKKRLEKEEDFDTQTDNSKKNLGVIKVGEQDDDAINEQTNLEDIKEDLYLSAYYHMDKGSGDTIEDITKNNNTAKINCIYNANSQDDELKLIWTDALEENDPLEYEDKWGRRSPPGHGIIFTKRLKTKISINSASQLHLMDRFTIELCIKLKDRMNLNIFTKKDTEFGIDKGQFTLYFHGQEIPPEPIKEYELPWDKYFHVAFLYKRSLQHSLVLLNGEEVVKFNFCLSGFESDDPLVFGNEKFDGEMAEIRIWNQRLPIAFIKENYKTPLPILSEKKKKLTMNITRKEKSKRMDSISLSSDKTLLEKRNRSSVPFEKNEGNQNDEQNNNNLGNMNDNGEGMNNDDGNEFGVEEYPDMDLISGASGEVNNNAGGFFDTGSLPSNDQIKENDMNFNT
jgi:hypothetical protein